MSKERLERIAERVQDLEKERDEWRDTSQSYYMTNQELRERNKRYREALEEIASEDEWETVDEARGMARKALEDGE